MKKVLFHAGIVLMMLSFCLLIFLIAGCNGKCGVITHKNGQQECMGHENCDNEMRCVPLVIKQKIKSPDSLFLDYCECLPARPDGEFCYIVETPWPREKPEDMNSLCRGSATCPDGQRCEIVAFKTDEEFVYYRCECSH